MGSEMCIRDRFWFNYLVTFGISDASLRVNLISIMVIVFMISSDLLNLISIFYNDVIIFCFELARGHVFGWIPWLHIKQWSSEAIKNVFWEQYIHTTNDGQIFQMAFDFVDEI